MARKNNSSGRDSLSVFTTSQQPILAHTEDKAQHDEIRIMKNEWDNICRKIYLIKMKDGIDYITITIASILTSLLAFLGKTAYNKFNLGMPLKKAFEESFLDVSVFVLSLIAYFVVSFIQNNTNIKCTNSTKENFIYLKEIQHDIEEINSRQK